MNRSDRKIIDDLCEHCRNGNEPTYRSDTKEWVHSWASRGAFSQTICRASEYRKSLDG